MVHQPVSRGLAVFAYAWLSGWLAEISADLRENGSALEVVPRRCAIIQIHDFTLLLLQRCPPRTGLDGVNEDGNLPYGRALQRERNCQPQKQNINIKQVLRQ